MEILMIGNGFDIEHGLPTKYADFLQFVERYNMAYAMAHKTPSQASAIKDEYLKFIFENPETNVVEALHEYLENNIWIAHFQNAYKEHLANKENWIDFESEISRIVQDVDELHRIYLDNDKKYFESKAQQCRDRLPNIFSNEFIYESGIKNFIPTMLNDLDRLIGALEIYIFDYIDKWANIEYYNPDLDALHPNAVLSFNYSNTWARVYAHNRANIQYSFVHGKAQGIPYEFDVNECIDKNMMVLGIDEYLPEERKDKEVEFIAFKKYYQRIYKKTGNEYKSWLAEINKRRKEGENEESTLYIFGHSLDVTDGDILKELIEYDGIKTVIFYKDKVRLGQQIANLVRVLGSEKVIQYVYGNNPIIEFRLQKNREVIQESKFEIVSDMARLNYFYNYADQEFNKMIAKLKQKIIENDFDYFCSQKIVISLYDQLQNYGLGDKFAKELFEITTSLDNKERTKEAVEFRFEEWYQLNDDGFYECSELTKTFIRLVNKKNMEKFIYG